MVAQHPAGSNTLRDDLGQLGEQASELQRVWGRALQALNRRGVQILVDFPGMLQRLNISLDKSQKNAQKLIKDLDQTRELVTTSALLTSSLELDDVLREVLDTVIKLTGAERAYLLLAQGDSGELKAHVARNAARETLTGEDITFSHGIINTAIEQKMPLLTTNAQADERFAGLKSVFVNELRSIVIVPLILKDKVVGALYADNRIEQGAFGPEMIPLLSAFANQAAIAISNARDFEKIRDDLKESQRQVQILKLEIDLKRVEEKVKEVTETDYFRELSAKASTMRQQSRND